MGGGEGVWGTKKLKTINQGCRENLDILDILVILDILDILDREYSRIIENENIENEKILETSITRMSTTGHFAKFAQNSDIQPQNFNIQ